MPNISSIERYNPKTDVVEKIGEAFALRMDDLIATWPKTPDGMDLFIAGNLYEIPITMVRTVAVLAKKHPGSYLSIFGSDSHIMEVIAAGAEVKLIGVCTIPPDERPDKNQWKHDYAKLALGAGCVGVLVDLEFDSIALARDFPEALFFRHLPDVVSSN